MNEADSLQEHIDRWCALSEPYPEIKVKMPNRYYAELLLEDYAGQVSEMTAINQYFYHYLLWEERFQDIAKLEECVSIIEMLHLEMLGKIIRLLGVEPRFNTLTSNRRTFWNAEYVYYGRGVCDRLSADIAAEKSAIAQYRKHQELIQDPYIDAVLERIIMDEEHHLYLFNQAWEKYCK
jgi:bacterioferritin